MHVAYIIVNEIEQCIWWKFVHPKAAGALEEDPMMPEDHVTIPENVLKRPGFYLLKAMMSYSDSGDVWWDNVEFEKTWPPGEDPPRCPKCDLKTICYMCYKDHDCRLCGGDIMNVPPVLRPFPGGEHDAPLCQSCYTDIGIDYLEKIDENDVSPEVFS